MSFRSPVRTALLWAGLIAFCTVPSHAGWGIKDLDPTNKNSGVRKQAKKLTKKPPKVPVHDINREAKKACETVQHVGKKAREDVQREIVRKRRGLAEEAWGEAGRVAYPAAAATMEARYVRRQAGMIPRHDRAVLKKHFGGLVDRVTVFWGTTPLNEWRAGGKSIHLGGEEADAQTYGYKVYIRSNRQTLSDQERLSILVHELTHVKQYERYGRSLSNFGYHYFKKFKQANQNYEDNKLEREAFETQSRIIAEVMVAYRVRTAPTKPALVVR